MEMYQIGFEYGWLYGCSLASLLLIIVYSLLWFIDNKNHKKEITVLNSVIAERDFNISKIKLQWEEAEFKFKRRFVPTLLIEKVSTSDYDISQLIKDKYAEGNEEYCDAYIKNNLTMRMAKQMEKHIKFTKEKPNTLNTITTAQLLVYKEVF